jgi:hypothetical protein
VSGCTARPARLGDATGHLLAGGAGVGDRLLAAGRGGSRSRLLQQNLYLAFAAYCVFCVIGILIASRDHLGLFARRPRRWLMLLFLAWLCLAALEPLAKGLAVAFGMDACALAFVFIVTYYTERLTFFDVLVKKAAFVFASLLLLTLYFAFVTPLIWAMHLRGWIGTLVWALSVWPIVLCGSLGTAQALALGGPALAGPPLLARRGHPLFPGRPAGRHQRRRVA